MFFEIFSAATEGAFAAGEDGNGAGARRVGIIPDANQTCDRLFAGSGFGSICHELRVAISAN
jgi:hypothetical protein